MRKPFDQDFVQTQAWNDPRYRANYLKFGLLGHDGIDYAVPTGTPIVAPHSGKIIVAGSDPTGYGNYIKLENEVEGSILAHLREFSVRQGDSVNEGQLLGYSDNTGNSTAAHLHWGYYRLPRNKNNGFAGYIDQTDWLNFKMPAVQEPKEQIIIDSYKALTGEYPSDDTKKWRLEQNKNTVEMIEDICANDGDFHKRWVTPNCPIQPAPQPPQEPHYNALTVLILKLLGKRP